MEPLPPCPKCGRNALVRHGSDRLFCLHCPYERNLAESQPEPMPWVLLGFLVWVGILGLLIYTDTVDSAPPSRPSPSKIC